MVNPAGERIATIAFNEACGLRQIVIVQCRELEFFCPTREVAFAACEQNLPVRSGRYMVLAASPEAQPTFAYEGAVA